LPAERLPHALIDVRPVGFALQAQDDGLESSVLDLVGLDDELARWTAGLALQLVDQRVLISTNICLKRPGLNRQPTVDYRPMAAQ